MSKNTKIEWSHHTINFWWGCTEVSPACTHCYAREWARYTSTRLFGRLVTWGKGQMRAERLERARMEALALDRKAKKSGQRFLVFANSMADWLDDEVPAAWLAHMLETIRLTPNLTWQLLTKRPENFEARVNEAFDHSHGDGWQSLWTQGDPPENVWIGTTVEDQTRADQRIPALLKIPAKVRYLSCEPLLGPVDLLEVCNGAYFQNPLTGSRWHDAENGATDREGERIHWVIAGGESGKATDIKPSNPQWFRQLRSQCVANGVPFFFKQWGEWVATDAIPLSSPLRSMPCKGTGYVDYKGKLWPVDQAPCSSYLVRRVGTHNSGNLLDGVEHREFPAEESELAMHT